MAYKDTYGTTSIELAALAGDGGEGTSYSAIGSTVQGSVKFGQTGAQTKDVFIEELDTAYGSFTTQKGSITVAWDTYNTSVQNFIRVFGGTLTGTGVTGDPYIYNAPDADQALELSLRITDKNGNKYTFPRVQFNANLNLRFTKDDYGAISLSGTILKSAKSGVPRYYKTQAV